MNVDDTLKQRGQVYGDYEGGCRTRIRIMEAIQSRCVEVNGRRLIEEHEEYIHDIVNKLSRLAASPDHIDTWHDIGGYSLLTEDILRKQQDEVQEPLK